MTSSCRYYFICDPHENVSSAYSLYYTASLVGDFNEINILYL